MVNQVKSPQQVMDEDLSGEDHVKYPASPGWRFVCRGPCQTPQQVLDEDLSMDDKSFTKSCMKICPMEDQDNSLKILNLQICARSRSCHVFYNLMLHCDTLHLDTLAPSQSHLSRSTKVQDKSVIVHCHDSDLVNKLLASLHSHMHWTMCEKNWIGLSSMMGL